MLREVIGSGSAACHVCECDVAESEARVREGARRPQARRSKPRGRCSMHRRALPPPPYFDHRPPRVTRRARTLSARCASSARCSARGARRSASSRGSSTTSRSRSSARSLLCLRAKAAHAGGDLLRLGHHPRRPRRLARRVDAALCLQIKNNSVADAREQREERERERDARRRAARVPVAWWR